MRSHPIPASPHVPSMLSALTTWMIRGTRRCLILDVSIATTTVSDQVREEGAAADLAAGNRCFPPNLSLSITAISCLIYGVNTPGRHYVISVFSVCSREFIATLQPLIS
ncbi:hypothetical protein J6590_040188 [Homalodisca vitripennis]|nr:hypothetical protein J6590_040188 [Homalodisca vitripennis]